MADWYYASGNDQNGPVSADDLRELAGSGDITPDTLVWREGKSNWIPASNVKGLVFARAPKALPPPPPRVKSPSNASPLTLGNKPPNVPSKHRLSIFSWTLIGIGSACAFCVTATVTWSVVHSRPEVARPAAAIGSRFSIRGSIGVFHTRQLTVGDNWRISWHFLDADRRTDSISVWPIHGNEALLSVDLGKSQPVKPRGLVGAVVIPDGGTYIIQISALRDWTLSVEGEDPTKPHAGIDVQPGDDKFMTSFLKSGGMN